MVSKLSAAHQRKGKDVADRLLKGEKLERGQSLTSRNGAYTLTLQDDGNLVLAGGGQAVWATDTNGQNAERLEVQEDGNCVLYTPDKPVWHTDTKGAKDVRLLLQDDRNLVLYGFDGPAWRPTRRLMKRRPRRPQRRRWFLPPPRNPLRHRSPNQQPRRPLLGHSRWCPVTPCGRSRNASTVTGGPGVDDPVAQREGGPGRNVRATIVCRRCLGKRWVCNVAASLSDEQLRVLLRDQFGYSNPQLTGTLGSLDT
jgi:hypothetical protein